MCRSKKRTTCLLLYSENPEVTRITSPPILLHKPNRMTTLSLKEGWPGMCPSKKVISMKEGRDRYWEIPDNIYCTKQEKQRRQGPEIHVTASVLVAN